MKIPDPNAHHPPGWAQFDDLVKRSVPITSFSLVADANRFRARYRLAKACRGLNLEGYTEETARGYDALTRLMLTWGALEAFLRAISKTAGDLPVLLARYDTDGWLGTIRSGDPDGRYFRFIAERITSRGLKEDVERHLRGDLCCATTLAQAVRHIFIHGVLTPNSNEATPGAVVVVCDALCEMLFAIMDREFSERVDQMRDRGAGPAEPLAPVERSREDDDYDETGYWPYGKDWPVKM
jgi:hypothetical protein